MCTQPLDAASGTAVVPVPNASSCPPAPVVFTSNPSGKPLTSPTELKLVMLTVDKLVSHKTSISTVANCIPLITTLVSGVGLEKPG